MGFRIDTTPSHALDRKQASRSGESVGSGSDVCSRHCDDVTHFMAEDTEHVSYPGVSAVGSRGPTTAVSKSCGPRALRSRDGRARVTPDDRES
ncbi:hypothetical protein EVAR_51538_1 [Eumeta japonica]|uniref:Uncharacterized protein n=1 Tax=Eumeta variegata TaxID=151549 RepID=A0A4C1XFJ5_EUMVA|nr:hypothetical protein EVAR_51538_1 [Eumeta japonica]